MLGICVGMQVLFEAGVEHGVETAGPRRAAAGGSSVCARRSCRTWAGTPCARPQGSALFAGLRRGTRFYFVHSYAARPAPAPSSPSRAPGPTVGAVTIAVHGEPFVAAVENGLVSATQFHPEKSGDAGARLLANWLGTL